MVIKMKTINLFSLDGIILKMRFVFFFLFFFSILNTSLHIPKAFFGCFVGSWLSGDLTIATASLDQMEVLSTPCLTRMSAFTSLLQTCAGTVHHHSALQPFWWYANHILSTVVKFCAPVFIFSVLMFSLVFSYYIHSKTQTFLKKNSILWPCFFPVKLVFFYHKSVGKS